MGLISWFCMSAAFAISLAGVLSIFKHPAVIVSELREAGVWGVRSMQILLLLSLFGLQWSMFGIFGRAAFHGPSLILYIIIIAEILAVFSVATERGIDFLAEHLSLVEIMKLVGVTQSVFAFFLILGGLGIGPISSEMATTASTKQTSLKIPSFHARWKHTTTIKSKKQSTEELITAIVDGDQFAITKSFGPIETTNIYSDKKYVQVMKINGGHREEHVEETIPEFIQADRIWLPKKKLKKASDQPPSPTLRPATLYEYVEDVGYGKKYIQHEWVDDESGIVLIRDNDFDDLQETFELQSFEAGTPEASSFDPNVY